MILYHFNNNKKLFKKVFSRRLIELKQISFNFFKRIHNYVGDKNVCSDPYQRASKSLILIYSSERRFGSGLGIRSFAHHSFAHFAQIK